MSRRYWIAKFEYGVVSPIRGFPWLWLASLALKWYEMARSPRHCWYRYYDIMDRQGIHS